MELNDRSLICRLFAELTFAICSRNFTQRPSASTRIGDADAMDVPCSARLHFSN